MNRLVYKKSEQNDGQLTTVRLQTFVPTILLCWSIGQEISWCSVMLYVLFYGTVYLFTFAV